MTCPRYDFHLHTKYTDAEAAMEVATIVPVAERLGITRLAITDHLHTAEEGAVHGRIREEIRETRTSLAIHFGVELDILPEGEPHFFTAELREQHGFQFAIAGLHLMLHEQCDWPKIVAAHHRRHLAVCENPLIDVLAHPYWFPCGYFSQFGWPLITTMDIVPDSCVRELAAASRETGTAIEINAGSCLEFFMWPPEFKRSYRDYIGRLAAAGALFSLGSDAHQLNQMQVIECAWQVVEESGIRPDQLWTPPGPPANMPIHA